MSESRYRQIETGRTTDGVPLGRPTPETLRRLEAALAIPVFTCELVLDGHASGVDLSSLPPIVLREDTARGERVIFAGPLDQCRLGAATDERANRYLQAG